MAVRLAKASGLAATSRIAFRGFSLSPWNAFYRPLASKYPQDVENSYLREQQEALGDKNKLFTVVEIQGEAQNAQQVVGFAIWNYAQQQERMAETVAIDLADEKDRSVDPYRANILFSATESAVQKCLAGHMELDNMAVDPDHFRKGYGTLLCRHGMDVAREDKVPVGVIAATLGMSLYEHLGYSCTAKVSIADGRPGEDASVNFWVQKWNPKDNSVVKVEVQIALFITRYLYDNVGCKVGWLQLVTALVNQARQQMTPMTQSGQANLEVGL